MFILCCFYPFPFLFLLEGILSLVNLQLCFNSIQSIASCLFLFFFLNTAVVVFTSCSLLISGCSYSISLIINFIAKLLCVMYFSRTYQIRSVAQSCLTLCDPMNRSMPGLPVHQQLLEFTQTHVHRVGDVIQPSHPLSSPSPPAPNPSQHQSLFP